MFVCVYTCRYPCRRHTLKGALRRYQIKAQFDQLNAIQHSSLNTEIESAPTDRPIDAANRCACCASCLWAQQPPHLFVCESRQQVSCFFQPSYPSICLHAFAFNELQIIAALIDSIKGRWRLLTKKTNFNFAKLNAWLKFNQYTFPSCLAGIQSGVLASKTHRLFILKILWFKKTSLLFKCVYPVLKVK